MPAQQRGAAWAVERLLAKFGCPPAVCPPKRPRPFTQQTRVYPYPLVAGSARPNPKMGAPDPENPLFLGFSVLRGGPRPWSETMVSEGARPWGGGRSGDCDLHIVDANLARD